MPTRLWHVAGSPAVPGDFSLATRSHLTGARPVAPPSRLDTDMYRALDEVGKRLYPGSTTLPTMLNGATDDDTIKYGAHSDVERLLESSLYGLVEFTWNTVTEVAVR